MVLVFRTCDAFRSADGLRWSTYLDECMNYLAQTSTEAQDQILVAQVKLQSMINQLRSTYREETGVETPVGYLDAPHFQLNSILTSLDGASTAFEGNCKLAFDLNRTSANALRQH